MSAVIVPMIIAALFALGIFLGWRTAVENQRLNGALADRGHAVCDEGERGEAS